MKKFITAAIAVILILSSSVFVNANGYSGIAENNKAFEKEQVLSDFKDVQTEELDFESELIDLYVEKTCFELSDVIEAKIVVPHKIACETEEYVIDKVEGFEIIGNIEKSNGGGKDKDEYTLYIKYDGITEYPMLLVSAVKKDNERLSDHLFGCVSDNKLFISDSSYDSAKEQSLYYKVITNEISFEKYNDLLCKEYSKYATENCEIILPDGNSFRSNPGAKVAPGGGSGGISYVTTINGYLRWKDDNNNYHPLQYNKVTIRDNRNSSTLGTVYTDVNGEFTFECLGGTYRDIYIMVFAEGQHANVKTANGGTYSYSGANNGSIYYNVASGSTLNITWSIDMTSELGRAMQISQPINTAANFVKQMSGSYVSNVAVVYPHTNPNHNGCYYKRSELTIFIKGVTTPRNGLYTYSSWDAITHEYGHHVQYDLGFAPTISASELNGVTTHYFTDNMADEIGNKGTGIRFAWKEAWPTVFGVMALQYYSSSLTNIATVGDSEYRSYSVSNGVNLENDPHVSGEACELTIIKILWDLYDSINETHDNIALGYYDWWDITTISETFTLSEFMQNFYTEYPEYIYDVGENLERELLAATNISITNRNSLSPTNAPIITWQPQCGSTVFSNMKHMVYIIDEDGEEILHTLMTMQSTYTLTQSQWDTVLNSGNDGFYVSIATLYSDAPLTGRYFSQKTSICDMPLSH